jgi:hypothetical protein
MAVLSIGGLVSTANYIGYLAGAMAGIFLPRLLHSRATLRISLVVVVFTLAGMPVTEDGTAWIVLRLIAGIASALVFMIAVSSMLTSLRAHRSHFIGWAFGGVGAGIAQRSGPRRRGTALASLDRPAPAVGFPA